MVPIDAGRVSKSPCPSFVKRVCGFGRASRRRASAVIVVVFGRRRRRGSMLLFVAAVVVAVTLQALVLPAGASAHGCLCTLGSFGTAALLRERQHITDEKIRIVSHTFLARDEGVHG